MIKSLIAASLIALSIGTASAGVRMSADNAPIEPKVGETCVTPDGLKKSIEDGVKQLNQTVNTINIDENKYAVAFTTAFMIVNNKVDLSEIPTPENLSNVIVTVAEDGSALVGFFEKGCADFVVVTNQQLLKPVMELFSEWLKKDNKATKEKEDHTL